ncbi:hypothetical protein HY572_04545 [Candidatus Micrarchaeota archaeon]|nr:hypothetical protein [Candidatus Micrarchaeota archaeon]
MGYLRFETPKAHYALELESHQEDWSDLDPQHMDALFFDYPLTKKDDAEYLGRVMNSKATLNAGDRKLRMLLAKAAQGGAEVWLGDFDLNREDVNLRLKYRPGPGRIIGMLLGGSALLDLLEILEKKKARGQQEAAQKLIEGEIQAHKTELAQQGKSRSNKLKKLEARLKRAQEIRDSATLSRRAFLGLGKKVGLKAGAAAFSYAFLPPFQALLHAVSWPGEIRRREIARRALAWYSGSFFPTAASEFRNAMGAKKLEEIVAETVAKERGKKPTIGMVWGANHASLKEHLMDPSLREAMIQHFRPHLDSLGVDAEVMQSLFRARFDPQRQLWHVEKVPAQH